MSAIASFVIWTIKVSVQMPLLRWHRAHWTKPTRSCASKSGRQQRSCWFTQECWFQSHRPRDWSAIIWQPVGIMFCNWLVSSCWLFLSVNGWNHKKDAAPQTTLHLLWLTVYMEDADLSANTNYFEGEECQFPVWPHFSPSFTNSSETHSAQSMWYNWSVGYSYLVLHRKYSWTQP